MNIRRTFIFLFGFIIGIMVILFFTMLWVIGNRIKILHNQEIRYKSYVIADELRQSSDNLTLYCRMYVMTGDSTWETKYRKLLDIRNGKLSRPNGRTIALKDSMEKLGLTNKELSLLHTSEFQSNQLVHTENIAFEAIKGKHLDTLGHQISKGEPDPIYAQKILFDKHYLDSKRRIMEPIGQFIVAIQERNMRLSQKYIKTGYIVLITSTSLILLVILITLFAYQLIRKKIEEQLAGELLLVEKVEELAIAKETTEQSDRLKSIFLANISHEIRTPMNGILGFIDLLKYEKLDKTKQQSYLEIISKSSLRLLNIINNILDLSKIASGSSRISITKVNIQERLNYLYHFFKEDADKKGLELILSCNISDVEDCNIRTDSKKFLAITICLLNNAIKFTEKGSIEIGCRKGDQDLEFYVKDTGIGIPKEQQEAIFEHFVQADLENKMARQGAGIGLSIAKGFVELLGGRMWVKSELGKGSQFYFTLKDMKETIADSKFNAKIPLENNGYKISNLKILIVEDNDTSEKLLTILVRPFSFETLVARTGFQAIESCRNHPDIDLILMDIGLPELDGYAATREIRKFNAEVIIISQTAHGLTGDVEKSIEAGCNDYLLKPIQKEKLYSLIHKYFDKY